MIAIINLSLYHYKRKSCNQNLDASDCLTETDAANDFGIDGDGSASKLF